MQICFHQTVTTISNISKWQRLTITTDKLLLVSVHRKTSTRSMDYNSDSMLPNQAIPRQISWIKMPRLSRDSSASFSRGNRTLFDTGTRGLRQPAHNSGNTFESVYSTTVYNVLGYSDFHNENPKYAEFYVDNKSVEIIRKKCNQKKLFSKNFGKVLEQKMTTCNFANFFTL